MELKPFGKKTWSGAEKRKAEQSQTPPKYNLKNTNIYKFLIFIKYNFKSTNIYNI